MVVINAELVKTADVTHSNYDRKIKLNIFSTHLFSFMHIIQLNDCIHLYLLSVTTTQITRFYEVLNDQLYLKYR